MGISTYMSYCGAQIFEPIGLNQALLNHYFRGLKTKIEGIGVFEVAEEALRQHQMAYSPKVADNLRNLALDLGGDYAYRIDGEAHMWTPDTIAKLQHAVRSGKVDTYREYAQLINEQSQKTKTLRGLFRFKTAATPIPLESVEPAKDIVKRFATGAMSLGSISTEAHVTLAVAMNRLGGKSNTGEGGEDPIRYLAEMQGQKMGVGNTLAGVLGADKVVVDYPLQEGDSLRSRIKQVASGRFGVTAAYLASADEIQIKMAQGAKPGEGGQLPGIK
jgi:glutamate synthase (NADPH/NADH) large chain